MITLSNTLSITPGITPTRQLLHTTKQASKQANLPLDSPLPQTFEASTWCQPVLPHLIDLPRLSHAFLSQAFPLPCQRLHSAQHHLLPTLPHRAHRGNPTQSCPGLLKRLNNKQGPAQPDTATVKDVEILLL